MTMPKGAEAYAADAAPVVARGISYTEGELDAMLHGPVKAILKDVVGLSTLHDLLATVVTTDFARDGLEEFMDADIPLDNWRVGEAVAEGFIAGHRDCEFPWPNSRDLKNPNASPAGCDLTGFRPTGEGEFPYQFAFGEVKTSEQKEWPPSVMQGRHGLIKQLEGLRDDRKVKDALIRYMGHRALKSSWEPQYKSAASRYFRSGSKDVALFGVLVRDVDAKSLDLAARAVALSTACPTETAIELYALYLPSSSITGLSTRATAVMEAGVTS